MNIKTDVKFHNRFDIEVRDKVTGELMQKGQAENIILNRMYSRLCNLSAYFSRIHFGKGTGTLSPTRTTLFIPLGNKSVDIEERILSYPVSKITGKITLNPEEFVGEAITEVGISDSSSAVNTHALIKDAEGNPLHLIKTDTDVVIIYATVFIELSNSNNSFYDKMPRNRLLYYLLGYSFGNFYIATSQIGARNDTLYGYYDDLDTRISPIPNESERKILIKGRVGINNNNRPTKVAGISGVAGAYIEDLGLLPFRIKDLIISSGDGETLQFDLPSESSNHLIKIDGMVTTEYNIEHYYEEIIHPLELGGLDTCYLNVPIGTLFHSRQYVVSLGNGEYIAIFSCNKVPNGASGYSLNKFKITGNMLRILHAIDIKPLTGYEANVQVLNDKTVIMQRYGSDRYFYDTETLSSVPSMSTEGFVSFNDTISEEGWDWRCMPGEIVGVYQTVNAGRRLVFNTPPPAGKVIELSCDVPYLPKTSDYVLDVSAEIQFGEGV